MGNQQNAQNWIDKEVVAKASTNIEAGLREGLSLLKKESFLSMPTIIFLTDGQPTYGEVAPDKLRQIVKSLNDFHVSIHSLAFGEGADMEFLTALSFENAGIAWKVYANNEAESEIENFFTSASQPLLRNLDFMYKLEDVMVNPEDIAWSYEHYYTGMEVVSTGKLPNAEEDWVMEVDVTAVGASGDYKQSKTLSSDRIEKPYVPRMWAHLWIQHLSKQILIAEGKDVDILTAEATALSLQYELVTPYTSFVIVADTDTQDDEKQKIQEPVSSQADIHMRSYHNESGCNEFQFLAVHITVIILLVSIF